MAGIVDVDDHHGQFFRHLRLQLDELAEKVFIGIIGRSRSYVDFNEAAVRSYEAAKVFLDVALLKGGKPKRGRGRPPGAKNKPK
jgi:hypothetical protein